MLPLQLNASEQGILDDIEFVGHGLLYSVQDDPEIDRPLRKQLLDPLYRFLKALRLEKNFDRVIIHDGFPAYAEIDGVTPNGRKCVRKIKFN